MENKEKNRIVKIKNWWKSPEALEVKNKNKETLIEYNKSEIGREKSSVTQKNRVKSKEEKEKLSRRRSRKTYCSYFV
ncbi:hypothetical protein LCGC14_3143900 [marine sediment metagenome]|uniref:Uncharacterized protein n=1 Tax=marine sediment metagenome TaxID=412755 RepID=A0A0F8WK11_9ZZZZ